MQVIAGSSCRGPSLHDILGCTTKVVGLGLTEAQHLLPIAGVPVIIENVLTSIRATLPRPCCHRVGLCPAGLNSLAIHPASPLHECKVKWDLAIIPVSREMKLWNGDSPVLEVGQIDGGEGIVAVKPPLEIFAPLASNVIRDEDP